MASSASVLSFGFSRNRQSNFAKSHSLTVFAFGTDLVSFWIGGLSGHTSLLIDDHKGVSSDYLRVM